jgi:transcriptional regulator with XRE-family HTH domain
MPLLLTEEEYHDRRAGEGGTRRPHRLCVLIRQLRKAAQWSLNDFETQFGIHVGPYERGDRLPPLDKLEAVLACYGYGLQAVADNPAAIRRPTDIVAELRAIADQLEAAHDVRELSHTAA